MPSTYKLTYFNVRGLAEYIRLILAQAGVDYEDIRIEREDWPSLRPTKPFGKLPVLEFDGKIISESRAIARFVARRHGLCGKDDLEAAQCDMLVDVLYDLHDEMRLYFYETDETKKVEMFNKTMNGTILATLKNFNKYLQASNSKNPYFVGTKLSWADIALAYTFSNLNDMYAAFMAKHNPSETHKYLEKYPLLDSFTERVMNLPNIAAWIAKRPVTEF